MLNQDGTPLPLPPESTKTKDGSTPPETSYPISLCNDVFHALMRRVDLYINGVKTGADHGYYPHISVLKNLFSYSRDAAESLLYNSILWRVKILIVHMILCIFKEIRFSA